MEGKIKMITIIKDEYGNLNIPIDIAVKNKIENGQSICAIKNIPEDNVYYPVEFDEDNNPKFDSIWLGGPIVPPLN